VLPAMFLLLECLGPRINASRGTASLGALARTVPFWIMAVAHLAFLSRPLQTYSTAPFSPEVLLHRLPGSLEIFARYLCLLLFPVHMRPFYGLHRVGSFFEPWPMLGGVLFVGIVLLGVVSWRRLPGASFGVGWYLLSIAPFLDLMAISRRQMGLADRYLYGPSVGFVILIVMLLDRAVSRLAERYSKRCRLLVLGMTTGVLVLFCTAVTAQYMQVWKNNLNLFSRMIEDFPDSPMPHANLGMTYLYLAELGQAIPELETAQRLNPREARPQISLALAYVTTGNPAAGFQLFDKIAPAAAQNHEYYALRGRAHLQVHEPKAAIGVARAGLQRFPTSLRLHFLLARAQEDDGDLDEAVRTFRQVLALEPNLAPAYEGLGRIFARQGDYGAAALALQHCREIEPDRLSAIRLLAQVREREGRAQDSLGLWREAATLTQDPSDRAEIERLVRRLQEASGARNDHP
jgi:tetratricopeptide (TPR) repeat protein